MRFETEQMKAFLAKGHPRFAFGIACLRFMRGPLLALTIIGMLSAYPSMPAQAIRAVVAAFR